MYKTRYNLLNLLYICDYHPTSIYVVTHRSNQAGHFLEKTEIGPYHKYEYV